MLGDKQGLARCSEGQGCAQGSSSSPSWAHGREQGAVGTVSAPMHSSRELGVSWPRDLSHPMQ